YGHARGSPQEPRTPVRSYEQRAGLLGQRHNFPPSPAQSSPQRGAFHVNRRVSNSSRWNLHIDPTPASILRGDSSAGHSPWIAAHALPSVSLATVERRTPVPSYEHDGTTSSPKAPSPVSVL